MTLQLRSVDDDLIQTMAVMGVPRSLIRPFKVDLKSMVRPLEVKTSSGDIKVISTTSQIKDFDRLKSSDFQSPFKFVLNANEMMNEARQLAVMVIHRAYAECVADPVTFNGSIPTWTHPNAYDRGYTSKLDLDSNALLVIDGMSTDMSRGMVELVRFILNTAASRPMLMIIGGAGAHEFCRDVLFIRVNHLIRLNPSRSSEVV